MSSLLHVGRSPTPPPDPCLAVEAEERPITPMPDEKPKTPKTPAQSEGMIQLSSQDKKELQVSC